MTDERVGTDWRLHGVRVVHAGELDVNTPQTPGMNRAAAINAARAGAEKLWAGTVDIQPDAKTGPHHHGPLESVIYVVSGQARMRWGERLEFMAEAGPGDFIYVPPFVPHQEINANPDAPCPASSCAAVRKQSSSTWTCPPSSPIRNRSTGSTTSTGSPERRRPSADDLPEGILRLILPSENSNRSQPRTSIGSPVAWVPRIVHSDTPRSPHVQWRPWP